MVKLHIITAICAVIGLNLFLFLGLDKVLKSRALIAPKQKLEVRSSLMIYFMFIFNSILPSVIMWYIVSMNEGIKSLIWDFVTFIPLTFLHEVVFDFVHYWTHRWMHTVSYLRSHHKLHHVWTVPSLISTYYQSPIDILLTNIVPSLIAAISVQLTPYQYDVWYAYKVYIELSGHCNRQINAGSFPQMVVLPQVLGIQLTIADHTYHHINPKCNYSKRLSLWDKVFCTYKKPVK